MTESLETLMLTTSTDPDPDATATSESLAPEAHAFVPGTGVKTFQSDAVAKIATLLSGTVTEVNGSTVRSYPLDEQQELVTESPQ